MNDYMIEAIKEAQDGMSCGHGGPFGCVIVKDGKIVGRGHNKVVLENNPILHGEMVAITDACKNLHNFDLHGCDIYTTGEPCPMCLGAIMWANIANIYYGCNCKDAEQIGFRDDVFFKKLESKQQTMHCIDREQCKKLFEEYTNLKDKIIY